MRYSAQHKEESRRKVLAATAKALRECGPEGISVASVMSQAGLTHGGFYGHFESKSELIACTIDYMFDVAAAKLDEQIADRPPRDALAAYVDFYLSGPHCAARQTGCPVAALGSDIPRLDLAARAAFARGIARRQRSLAALMRQAGAADPEAAASSLIAELLGALINARLADEAGRDAILEASRQALYVRYGLGGT
ncbi:MAG: TetR/AcrR family transcriptional regulator [Bordetella sp.]|uniref:TetR/AcrR family transcriptional regulator n=1 Tax=Bordetella sp. TaxID=28081 RepID=UPI003F7C189B